VRELIRKNPLLDRVRAGRPAFGPELRLGRAPVVELIGRFPFHWVNIDLEHAPYTSFETVEHMCRAANVAGLTPVVSVGDNNRLTIAKCLEAGCAGIVVPHVFSKADAEEAVIAARYPPLGGRGATGAVRQHGYATDLSRWPATIDAVNRDILVIGKIEDVEALDHLDGILSTGIDGLMFGAFDLTHSLADPAARGRVSDPRVREAANLMVAKCREHGKIAAALPGQLQEDGKPVGEVVRQWVASGVLMWMLPNEFTMIGEWCRRTADSLGLADLS
jgi:4-hydroxy-2-oxoheptanedioate aldolase